MILRIYYNKYQKLKSLLETFQHKESFNEIPISKILLKRWLACASLSPYSHKKHQRSREKLRKCCYSWKVFFIIAWVHVGWFNETWILKGVFVIKLQLSLKVVSLIAFHLHLKLFCCYTWLITCITVCIWHYEAISNLV